MIGRHGAKRIIQRQLRKRGFTLERYPNRLGLAHHLREVCRLHRADCIIDVGANRGQFGVMVREVGLNLPMLSFEPGATAYAELARNASRYPGTWQARSAALGREPGERDLNVARSTSVSSFLHPAQTYTDWYEGAVIDHSERVSVVTLDSVMDEMVHQRVFLKLDTQGFDMEVLAGGRGSFNRIAVLQVELSAIPVYDGMPDYLVVLQQLRELGFTPTGFFPVASDRALRAYEFDGVFVRR